jgi:DNA-binding winged helix-turn-helix (wHTH) protein
MPRSVLVAVAPGRALTLARCFGDAGFAPTLAFTTAQLADFAAVAVDVVVADDLVDAEAGTLRHVGDEFHTVRVFVGHPNRRMPPEVHTIVSAELPATEVVSRARTLVTLRGEYTDGDGVLTWGPLELDTARRDAHWHGMPMALTPTQFRIVAALVRARGGVVTKHELQREVWPDTPPDAGDRLVAHIRRIRTKIENDSAHPHFLVTARGLGFRLADGVGDQNGPEWGNGWDDPWDGTERRRVDRRRPRRSP